MIIPLEFYAHLRQQVRVSDIVRQKISLTKKSGNYFGLCPFHSEKTPSFSVNDVKNFYHCFGCGENGDAIKFVSKTTGLSYKESAIKIAQDYSIELPKISPHQQKQYQESEEIYEILAIATDYFIQGLTPEVIDYLDLRGVDKQTRNNWSIGYTHKKGELIECFEKKTIPLKDLVKSGLAAKGEDGRIYEIFNNRIMFPIRNIYNKVVGFGGRAFGDYLPKYINSPETLIFKKSEILYGEHVATSASYKTNYSIIVEGYMDVIALHKSGICEASASLGTAVNEKHLQKLWKSSDEVIACLDGDEAGQRAGRKLVNIALPLIEHNKKISFINLPKSQDPDDIIKKGGASLFNKKLAQRVNLSEQIWLQEYNGKDYNSAESKAELEHNLMIYCDQITDKMLSTNFRRYFKEQLWQNLYKYNGKLVQNRQIVRKSTLGDHDQKNYNEIEMIELSICNFMVKFPETVRSFADDNVLGLTLSSEKLNEFKDWFVEKLENHDNLDDSKLKELAKNSGFYNKFLVLFDPEEILLDNVFIKNNQDQLNLIFKWLGKKHYLLLLKQEYINLMQKVTEASEEKGGFLLKEIKKTSCDIDMLNQLFSS